MSGIERVIEVASNEVGYCRFNDPERGTKYGRWYAGLVGESYYGENDVPFCAMFVSWVFANAGVSCVGFPSAYCPYIHNNQNVSKYDLKRGDAVLFDWDDDSVDDHVGIVEYVDNAGVHTIEGNTGDGDVARRVRSLSTICGGVRPDYSEPSFVDVDALARAVIAGEYGNGAERRERLGELYDQVQARVNQILNGSGADIEQLARAVIAGEYGNGAERRERLGELYDQVQARVNEILS